ncbi:head maturation protease [Burkholderia phage BcepNazgul]|nr:head maturation protease [Burkholderia phage BcepNazgul]AAQ63360.2 Nu3 protein [Burkholderia phage BcepNazgul]
MELTEEQLAAERRAAIKADRERQAGILNCEEAKGKPKLANHIALNTEMSVDDAKVMLAAAAPEVTSDPADTSKNATAFHKAMDSSSNPEVGADPAGGKGNEAEGKKGGNVLLASLAKATGRKDLIQQKK